MYPKIKEKDMQRLAAYQAELRKKPALRYLFFEMTDQCNLNCIHCGSSCLGRNHAFLKVEGIRQVLESVAAAYDPASIMICITGGEPLLHPGLYEVINMSHQLGFPVGITTNGTLIDNMSARQLVLAGLDTIAVSIDGIGDVHDDFRRVRRSYDRAILGIHALQHVGMDPQIITVVHKENIDQLEEMYRLFQRMGIYSWRLVNMEPIGRAAKNTRLLLEGQDIKRLFQFIREKRYDPENDMEVTYGCSHYAGYEYEKEIRDFYFQCGAGLCVASISAEGDMIGCLDIERRKELIQGNIYKDDFVTVWETQYQIFRRDRTEESRQCRACPHKEVCLGDSLHTWNFDLKEPNYCIARMLMEEEKCWED